MGLNCLVKLINKHFITMSFGILLVSCIIVPLLTISVSGYKNQQMGTEHDNNSVGIDFSKWNNLKEPTTRPYIRSSKNVFNRQNFTRLTTFVYLTSKKVENEEVGTTATHENITIDTSKNNWQKYKNYIINNNENSGRFYNSEPNIFCGSPEIGNAQLVFASDEGKNMLNFNIINSMCKMQMKYIEIMSYEKICTGAENYPPGDPRNCCEAWSLPNYIAQMNHKTSCLLITESDVYNTESTLKRCASFYRESKISPDCSVKGNCQVPQECVLFDNVYNIFTYITDNEFFLPKKSEDMKVSETIMILPMPAGEFLMPFYKRLTENLLHMDGISVVAMNLGLKHALFRESLPSDVTYILFGAMALTLCMCIYTRSAFLTTMAISALFASISLGYFLYFYIFRFTSFPFMNTLAIIVSIAIGTHDSLIFCDIWTVEYETSYKSLTCIMSYTVRHTLMSMAVTSMTTSVTFLTTYWSSDTTIRLIGLFAGIAILSHFILLLCWVVAVAVVKEQLTTFEKLRNLLKIRSTVIKRLTQRPKRYMILFDVLCKFMANAICRFIEKFRHSLFISLSLLSLASVFILIYHPYHEQTYFNYQIFISDHPFEQYDLKYKFDFQFSQINNPLDKLPLRFIWGILPDKENNKNPRFLEKITYDPSFNISSTESQEWLLGFCQRLRQQKFYLTTANNNKNNCFMESFIIWMNRNCDDNSSENMRPCCEVKDFPYKPELFDYCLKKTTPEPYEEGITQVLPGPKFVDEKYVGAIIIEYSSNYSFSTSVDYQQLFKEKINTWFVDELSNAPKGLKNGWLVTDFDLYELYRVLAISSIIGTFLSILLSMMVIYFSTLNLIIGILTIFCITCNIVTTMASLLILGWYVDLLKAIALSSTISLSIDYSLQVAINYKSCPTKNDRLIAMKFAMQQIMGPLTMASISISIIGYFIMLSEILIYKLIGQFLMIIMGFSWIFAVLHLGSLLALVGPENSYGQCKIKCWFSKNAETIQKEDTNAAPPSKLETPDDQYTVAYNKSDKPEATITIEPIKSPCNSTVVVVEDN
ncbi:PREDICTED: protein dispatched homolog 1-like isoform X1 [Nicrophorus vespilloides]|uniref:Protein dispatched homolog 1-like isoform X1 n=1 Tax=Nicrophorus vespilloides TaxID=110193 RepID=A0ABM1N2G8_NICVS|nr:PREDICTED: protein dispatched homolog 1-like isoform X1 [Nicrophorus vespilloides]